MGRRFWRACRRFLWCGRWPQPEKKLRRSPDGRRRVTDRQRQLRSDGNGRAGDIDDSRLWSDRLVNCSMTTICRAGSLRLNASMDNEENIGDNTVLVEISQPGK